jgi:hypothetical protein
MVLAEPAGPALADPQGDSVDLVVDAGRPLRVALQERLRVKRVGQPVAARLVEPVFAYDRIVVPAGATVVGSIERLDRPSRRARWFGLLRLDFSPPRPVVLRFEKLMLADGREIPITTRVGPGLGSVVLSSSAPRKRSLTTRAADAAKDAAKHTLGGIRRRGHLRAFKDAVLASLPFHAQHVSEGTVYDAELLEALEFGVATATPRALSGTPAPADAVLSARLVTALNSGTTPRGTPIQAVLTIPLFSAEGHLILPEGTEIAGEVTFARPARPFRRNGQLRLLFESARAPEEPSMSLLASLYAAEVSGGSRLSIDDEGGARATNASSRFVGPALAAGAVAASFALEPVTEPGRIEPGVLPGAVEPNSLGTAAGGFSGLGLLGIGLSQLSRPTAVGLGVVGLGRNLYTGVIGKGREVSLPAGTRIQVQIAPPASAPLAEPTAP